MKFSTLCLLCILCLFIIQCGDGADSLAHLGVCEGYTDPAVSHYTLPWVVGESFIISQGNCSPVSHNAHQKYAYDVSMDIGSTITAIRSGTVIDVEESYSDGSPCPNNNYVYILHNDGTVAGYLHLTRNGALVNKGDNVFQGQAIALSGNTGCSSGPHLHLVVFENNERQESVAITFSNANKGNRRGLQADIEYTAE